MKHLSADITSTARRVLEELFPANDTAAVTALTSERFVNHEAPPGTPPGPGSVTRFMRMLNDAFAEQKWTIHQTVTEGDRVVVHCT
ncbi:MAG: ester cyclase, partial [Dermatophilaceae bacterium]